MAIGYSYSVHFTQSRRKNKFTCFPHFKSTPALVLSSTTIVISFLSYDYNEIYLMIAFRF